MMIKVRETYILSQIGLNQDIDYNEFGWYKNEHLLFKLDIFMKIIFKYIFDKLKS